MDAFEKLEVTGLIGLLTFKRYENENDFSTVCTTNRCTQLLMVYTTLGPSATEGSPISWTEVTLGIAEGSLSGSCGRVWWLTLFSIKDSFLFKTTFCQPKKPLNGLRLKCGTVLRQIFVHCDTFLSTFAAFPRPSCYIDNITK